MDNIIGSVEKNKGCRFNLQILIKLQVNQFLILFRILLMPLTEKIFHTHGSMENALWKKEMSSHC